MLLDNDLKLLVQSRYLGVFYESVEEEYAVVLRLFKDLLNKIKNRNDAGAGKRLNNTSVISIPA